MFGGTTGTARLNDVWSLSLEGTPTWSELLPAGPLPLGREQAGAVYDAIRQRLVIYGGGSFFSDVWSLPLSGDSLVWTKHATSFVYGRRSFATAYDALYDRMVVFGGDGNNGPLSDVWSLSLANNTWTAWLNLLPVPTPRIRPAAIVDPATHRLVIFGGVASQDRHLDDLWELSLDGTQEWSLKAPIPAQNYSLVLDPVAREMLMFGGQVPAPAPVYAHGDLYAMRLGAGPRPWVSIESNGTRPSARFAHRAVWDAARDRMLMFGGQGEGSVPLGDVW